MIKKFNQLKRRKGFTLVECIVAIAVFALLTAVILMILANAQAQATRSRESEEDLNNLVENVVGDDTYKKYSDSSSTLTLDLSTGNTFKISYDTVAGYKNYVLCDTNAGGCGYVGNNTEFMHGLDIDDFVDAINNGTSDKDYKCPKCGATVAQTLECQGCYTTGSYTNTSLFTCSPYTGSFTCISCGGGNVKGDNIDEAVTADANFRITGLSANSIRYGNVELHKSTTDLIQTDSSSCRVDISYAHQFDNLTLPGVYTMVFTTSLGGGSYIDVYLPPWYVIKDCKVDSSKSTGTAVVNTYQTDLSKNDVNDPNISHIRIDKETTATSLPSKIAIQFTLTNYKNGYSFDYDYRLPYDIDGNGSLDATEQKTRGLIGYWFRMYNNARNTVYNQDANGNNTDIVTNDGVTGVDVLNGGLYTDPQSP